MSSEEITARLEYLRGELRAERISLGELIDLQGLAPHIDPGDVELLEVAGVPESSDPEPVWQWPAGKTFGELSPADKAAAPAITGILEGSRYHEHWRPGQQLARHRHDGGGPP